jgi:hypothetical protein
MPEIDREILDRASRWCAESGRPVRAEDVLRALEPLGWDELLAVKAILADPPPARNLGPVDLVALSRGALPRGDAPASAPRPSSSRTPRAARPAAAPRIRRARDRAEPAAAAPPRPASFDVLFREAGRAEVERRTRRLGANRAAILADLGRGFARPDGEPLSHEDLDRLLEHHGLARGFAEHERALLLHTLRKHRGVLARSAAALGIDAASLSASLDRLGLRAEAESIRETRRRGLDRKGTLSERARLLDEEEEALADLGLRDAWVEDLRSRLPGHLRALVATGRAPSAIDLGRSLSLSRGAVDRLVARFALRLRPSPADRGAGPARARPSGRPTGRRTGPPRRPTSGRRPTAGRPRRPL